MTPAAAVRRSLAQSRDEGLTFEAAWRRALALVPVDPRTTRAALPAQDWRAAVVTSKAAFRRSYEGREPTRGDYAVGALADAL